MEKQGVGVSIRHRAKDRGQWAKTLCPMPYALCPLLLILLLSSCGYHVVGKSGTMPGGVTTISIPFFKNQVQKPDVETIITTTLIDEFVKSSVVKVVDKKDSEAILRGVITDYSLTPVSFNKNDVAQEYRLSIKLEIELVRISDGKILWKDKAITDYEDFKVTSTDINATKTAEKEVLKKIAKDTARLVKERILEQF